MTIHNKIVNDLFIIFVWLSVYEWQVFENNNLVLNISHKSQKITEKLNITISFPRSTVAGWVIKNPTKSTGFH